MPPLERWGATAVSIFSLVIFLASIVVAFVVKNDTALTLLLGAASANATTVISYWVGSSHGSQKKDETIASLSTAPIVTAPVTGAVP